MIAKGESGFATINRSLKATKAMSRISKSEILREMVILSRQSALAKFAVTLEEARFLPPWVILLRIDGSKKLVSANEKKVGELVSSLK